jgi:hypothetical protein
MTLRRPGGARPILGERTRESLNVHLSCFRYGWLSWIADSLSQKNDGVEPRASIPDITIDRKRIETLAGALDENDWYYVLAEGRRQTENYKRVGTLIDLLSPGDVRKQILERVKPLHKLPQVNLDGTLDRSREINSTPEDIAALIQFVLLPIEKSDLFVATLNIVLDEPRVSKWIQRLRRDAAKTRRLAQQAAGAQPGADAGGEHPIGDSDVEVSPVDVIESLKELCPPSSRYLMSYLSLVAAALKDGRYFGEEVFSKLEGGCKMESGGQSLESEDLRPRLINRCERAAFLVALMLMHKTEAGRTQMKTYFSPLGRLPSGNGEYRLPETTVITYDALRLLMQSLEVTVADILGIRGRYDHILPSLQELSAEGGLESPGNDGPENPHEWFLRVIKKLEVSKLFSEVFGFGCQGPPPQFPIFKEQEAGQPSEHLLGIVVEDICGWTPKNDHTCSILLIGSPGCGKSNSFLSGIAKFVAAIARKSGFTCSFSPLSDMLLDRIKTAFSARKEPVRTELGTYHSIEFTLEEERGNRKLHFVIDDVAGEQATQRLREGESSTIVRQTLRSADVVVVFLDISIDPELATKIEVGPQKETLKALIDCRRKAREDREDKVSENSGGSSSVADVSQLQFVDSIVAECKRDRTPNAMPNLILVIPKADLYASPEESCDDGSRVDATSPHIMQEVFRNAKNRGTLFMQKTGHQEEDSKLKWLTSAGVTYKHTDNSRRPIEGYVNAVVTEMDLLSKDGKSALLNIGRLLDSDNPVGQDAKNYNDQMDAHISGLEREFKSVHLLPVSAQGKPAGTGGGGRRQLNGFAQQANNDDVPGYRDHSDPMPVETSIKAPLQNIEDRRNLLGHPQKFCEFLILGPAMMLVKKHWIDSNVSDRTQQTQQIPPDPAPAGNVKDPQRPDGQ